MGVGVASAFVYDKLNNFKNAKLKIGKKEISIIKDKIHKAIKEEFEK